MKSAAKHVAYTALGVMAAGALLQLMEGFGPTAKVSEFIQDGFDR